MATVTTARMDDPLIARPAVVRRVRKETPDTYTLEVVPEGGGHPFKPGQIAMLSLPGIGEVPIAICGEPDRPEVWVHTIRVVGAVTRALCRVKRGEVIGVRGPYGTPWPMQEAEGEDVVLIAGGMGLAPLRPALYHVLANRRKYGRVVVLYGARTPRDMLYRKELEQWRGRFDLGVHAIVDHAGPDWLGHVGVVTRLLPRAYFDPTSTVAMVCGPGGMMRFTVRELLGRGIPRESIYLSLERNMKCAVGLCGRCQYGPFFVCKDGPVFRYDKIEWLMGKREI
jgi:NAD(P)H-flavin reductase